MKLIAYKIVVELAIPGKYLHNNIFFTFQTISIATSEQHFALSGFISQLNFLSP